MACCGRENTDASLHQDCDMSLHQQEPDTLENFQLSSGFVLNTEMAKDKMEADLGTSPTSTTVDANLLRRSSSIPLINGFGDNSQGYQVDPIRMRRNSSPFLNRRALFLPSHTRTSANRIFQIKQEEGMDIASREAMHEREMHTAMQINQSWEESLSLNDNGAMKPFTVRNTKIIPGSPMTFLIKKPGKDSQDHQNF
ncbi:P2R1A-PPP2R2A-interacting phosphatase regulator 1-like [Mesocricetus auratus]|uniref:P2R1A-PPP2R2A-interacting phosphatase regulator 1-like n=1 Tax=Mesocricetus auratus TaxID=10036 RepID=A0ABM2XAF8_MESAU|nr:P2R1A-PPP2R2A-interacting phosphatase regulator 1-like [Mesocricetus auratus]XP_040599828.1 P2R1A-PPP2R2A-interacting phosphatase regulator 1-like [Mesocricetus auratus]